MNLSFRAFRLLWLAGWIACSLFLEISVGYAAEVGGPIIQKIDFRQEPIGQKKRPVMEHSGCRLCDVQSYINGSILQLNDGFMIFFAVGGNYVGLKDGQIVDCGGWGMAVGTRGIEVAVHSERKDMLGRRVFFWPPHQLHELLEGDIWRAKDPWVRRTCRGLLP